jgi:hypothetical protein
MSVWVSGGGGRRCFIVLNLAAHLQYLAGEPGRTGAAIGTSRTSVVY